MNSVQSQPPLMYVLLGCPGSGKGTFAQTVISRGFEHISTGDITREEVRKGTPFGIKYKEAIVNHVIGGIPFDEIQRLVENRLEMAIESRKGIILDGYPKTVGQCEFLERFIQKNGLRDRVDILVFEVDEEDAIERIRFRQTCETCNRIYNSKFLPPKKIGECDGCHARLAQRIDDVDESTRKRVIEFKSKMKPVLDFYSGRSYSLTSNP